MAGLLIKNLRSARDLRSAIVDLAISLVESHDDLAHLTISGSQLSTAKVQAEWGRALRVLDKGIQDRLRYQIVEEDQRATAGGSKKLVLSKPNYRYEIVRQLLHAQFEQGSASLPMGTLIKAIGVSETPIRKAIYDLRRFGLLSPRERRIELKEGAGSLSWEALAAAEATPQVLKFRFGRGTQIRTPPYMLERAVPLLEVHRSEDEWQKMSLSGVPVAQRDFPQIDIFGIPRLDLQLRAGEVPAFYAHDMHKLVDGLELEENRLEPAPVVVMVTRSRAQLEREGDGNVREAAKCDVFISLLNSGLRDQAIQYARRFS